MKQPSPRQNNTTEDLGETWQAKQLDVQLIRDSKDKEFEPRSKINTHDKLPSPTTRKIQTRAVVRLIPMKATIRAFASQGGSSLKKARK